MMNSVRTQPQAKYQLLLENSRSPISIKHSCNGLAIAGLIIAIIGATIIAVVLSWQSFTTNDETQFLLEMVEFSDSHKFPAEQFHRRSYLYGKALNIVLKRNESVEMMRKPEASPSPSNPLKLVCYYNINKNASNLLPEDIDPYLCTHLNIAFAEVQNSTVIANDPSDEKAYKQLTNLKVANPALKVLISVGGGGEDTDGFASMVKTYKSRNIFINSTIAFLSKYNLDGIDFDWEFPDQKQGRLFLKLLNEFQLIINENKLIIIISVAVAAPQSIIDTSYDIPALSKCVDFVNVMSYDYHFYVWYLPVTGINAPLYPRLSDKGIMKTLNMNYTAWYWRTKGMPADKIIIGLPTYGHSFQLVNTQNNGMNAPASGNGILGTDGFISYTDVCWFQTKGQANEVFDAETKSPYAYRGKEWVSFDDAQSLSYKAQFIVNSGFGGAMILSLNNDDYKGECTEGKVRFPLTRQVANVLQDDQL